MKILYRLSHWVTAFACLSQLMSCESELYVNPGPQTVVSVTGLDRLSAKPGEEVKVTGRNLTSRLAVDVEGKSVDLKVSDAKNGSFALPADIATGFVQVTFRKDETVLAKFPLVNGDTPDTTMTIAAPANLICSDMIFKDAQGELTRGERNCSETPAPCTRDGQTDCLATEDAPSALKTGLNAKVLSGQTVAGVSGSAALRPSDCVVDGGINCVAVALFPAVDKATKLSVGNAAKIHSTLSIAGVSGTMASCSVDGGTGCMAVAGYPAANTSGAAAKIASGDVLAGITGTAGVRPSDCSTDGGTGCVAVGPTYAAAITAGVAAKVLTGQSVAGISGSATVAPANCAADGATNCVAVTNFPAVDKLTNLAVGNLAKISSSVTVGGVVGTLANCSVDGTTACLTVSGFPSANTTGAAAKILSGQTLAGVSGSATAAPINCSSDGQTDCVAITTYPALQKSLLTASVLKNGTVINGVTGAYPNATYPLAGSTATADLTAATFSAQVKSTTAFEYFDSTGALQSGAGDDDITAANILSPISIFGTSGTAPALVAPDAWNVRVGSVINGVTGQLKTSCRNRTNTSLWDTSVPYTAVDATDDTLTITAHPFTSNMTVRVGASTAPTGLTINSTTYYVIYVDANTIRLSATSGPGTQVDITTVGSNVTVYQWSDGTLQWWDTIDDYNNNLVYPSNLVSGWSSDTDCNYSDWQDLTADGTCNAAADDCIMKDRITGLTWSESYPVAGVAAGSTTLSWQKAIQHCNNLSWGGFSGWRLATQKELLEAYIHGIRDVGYNGTGTIRGSGSTHNNDQFILNTDTNYWSASSASNNTTNAWLVVLRSGYTYDPAKSDTWQVLCVR